MANSTSDVQGREAWRERVTPDRRGPWKLLQAGIRGKGWYAHLWQDITLDDNEIIQLWGLPPLIGLVMRQDGERVGLLYESPPDYAKEKKRARREI